MSNSSISSVSLTPTPLLLQFGFTIQHAAASSSERLAAARYNVLMAYLQIHGRCLEGEVEASGLAARCRIGRGEHVFHALAMFAVNEIPWDWPRAPR